MFRNDSWYNKTTARIIYKEPTIKFLKIVSAYSVTLKQIEY